MYKKILPSVQPTTSLYINSKFESKTIASNQYQSLIYKALKPLSLSDIHEKFIILAKIKLKSRVHCFTMQVVMNECFLLNPEKNYLAQIRLAVFDKNAPLFPKNDVTEPKATC